MGSNAPSLDDVVIRKVNSLNEPKLQEIIDVYVESYRDDIYRGPFVKKENGCGRYMASGMYCTAIMNGFALVAEDKRDGRVLGGSGFFSPGSDKIFGSEEQTILSGYKTMHELMTEEENKLWDEQTKLWFSLVDEGSPKSSTEHGYAIMQLFVSPSARKRGIGTKMINEYLKVLKASSDPDAFIFLGAYTPTAIRLYESLGFKITSSTDKMPLEPEKADGAPRKYMRAVLMTITKSSMDMTVDEITRN